MKIIKILQTALFIFFLSVGEVFAQTPPDFPACSNPQGTLQVQYNSGIHGVAGDPNAYTGSDAVYTIDNDRNLQCFCSDAGNGIQTNWWRVGSLTQDEIDTLVKLGWTFIPDGSVWGLNPEPYMAFNSSFACGGGSSSNSTSGQVQAASSTTAGSGSVLGLATTGDSITIYGLAVAGLISLTLGRILRKKTNTYSS